MAPEKYLVVSFKQCMESSIATQLWKQTEKWDLMTLSTADCLANAALIIFSLIWKMAFYFSPPSTSLFWEALGREK